MPCLNRRVKRCLLQRRLDNGPTQPGNIVFDRQPHYDLLHGFVIPACCYYLCSNVSLIVGVILFTVDRVQRNRELRNCGKQESSKVPLSNDFAGQPYLVERLDGSGFGQDRVKTVGEGSKHHVRQKYGDGNHQRQVQRSEPGERADGRGAPYGCRRIEAPHVG